MGDRKPSAEQGTHPPKLCVSCGRAITWRRKFERNWDTVKFCSEGCRTHRPGAEDEALEAAILRLLAERARDRTICPSEAARAIAPDDWQPLMQQARAAARRLVAAGKIVITQKGTVVVDPSTAKGPIRLRLR